MPSPDLGFGAGHWKSVCIQKLKRKTERWLDSPNSSSCGVKRKCHHNCSQCVNIYHHLIKDDYLDLKGV